MSMLILMTVFARKSDVDKVGHTSERRSRPIVPCSLQRRRQIQVRADNHSLVALCQGYLTRIGNRKHLARARVCRCTVSIPSVLKDSLTNTHCCNLSQYFNGPIDWDDFPNTTD